jgi:hypothetical protein
LFQRFEKVFWNMNIWEAFEVEEGRYYNCRIGPLDLLVQRSGDEYIAGWQYDNSVPGRLSAEVLDAPPPCEIDWHRKVLQKSRDTIKLVPAMPDRAVVVKPASELKLSKETEALFYIRIPLWIHVCSGKDFAETLYEIPSVVMSHTWFGEPHAGDLCYSLTTNARRSLEKAEPRAHQAICPVYIKNSSHEDLEFKRLCVRVRYLSVFMGEKEMWTNAIHVQYRGVDKESTVKFDDNPPKGIAGLTKVGEARKHSTKSFARKSFDTFRLFSNGV